MISPLKNQIYNKYTNINNNNHNNYSENKKY